MSAAIELCSGFNAGEGYSWARAVIPCAINGGSERHVFRRVEGQDPRAAHVKLMIELCTEFPRASIGEHT